MKPNRERESLERWHSYIYTNKKRNATGWL